jgi:hypothetical protein
MRRCEREGAVCDLGGGVGLRARRRRACSGRGIRSRSRCWRRRGRCERCNVDEYALIAFLLVEIVSKAQARRSNSGRKPAQNSPPRVPTSLARNDFAFGGDMPRLQLGSTEGPNAEPQIRSRQEVCDAHACDHHGSDCGRDPACGWRRRPDSPRRQQSRLRGSKWSLGLRCSSFTRP